METHTFEVGGMANSTETEPTLGQMEVNMSVSSRMAKKTDNELTGLQRAINTLVSGKTVSSTEKASKPMWMAE